MVDVETDALLDVRVNVEEVVLEVVPMDARAVEVVVPDANRVVRILVLPHVETGAEITALVDVRVLAHPVVLVIVNLVVLETVPVDAQELVQVSCGKSCSSDCNAGCTRSCATTCTSSCTGNCSGQCYGTSVFVR